MAFNTRATHDATFQQYTIVRKREYGDDPAPPHAYGNRRVLAALPRRLNPPAGADLPQIEVARLQAAAAVEPRDDLATCHYQRNATPNKGPLIVRSSSLLSDLNL